MQSITTKQNGKLNPEEFRDGILSDNNKIRIEPPEPTPHSEILSKLVGKVKPVNFRKEAGLGEDDKIHQKHYVVLTVEKLLELAEKNNWGLCKRHDFVYLYNGAYWSQLEESELQLFLSRAAAKMGVDEFDWKHHRFRDELLKQFHSVAYLPKPEQPDNTVLINLQNGTVEINPDGERTVHLRQPNRNDFLTYQLPFKYDRQAKAPLFQKYLDRVLPEKSLQNILAEYIGYVFVKTSTLKLEKALILHGPGGNGKSVLFDIVNALLGEQNVSTFTLHSLTDNTGYYRAKLANKLVNYASEISGNMETSYFKQLVSGEPVQARNPYKEPFTLKDYAKLIFNCNELPTEVEHTNAFFRRFMIVPFEVTIPESEQDKELSKKIIDNELSGIFNWVLSGLQRVLEQKGFTRSDVVEKRNQQYRKESDSVAMFISEKGYQRDVTGYTTLAEFYGKYKRFCEADGYFPVSKRKLSSRLRSSGHQVKRLSVGNVVYLTNE